MLEERGDQFHGAGERALHRTFVRVLHGHLVDRRMRRSHRLAVIHVHPGPARELEGDVFDDVPEIRAASQALEEAAGCALRAAVLVQPGQRVR